MIFHRRWYRLRKNYPWYGSSSDGLYRTLKGQIVREGWFLFGFIPLYIRTTEVNLERSPF